MSPELFPPTSVEKLQMMQNTKFEQETDKNYSLMQADHCPGMCLS